MRLEGSFSDPFGEFPARDSVLKVGLVALANAVRLVPEDEAAIWQAVSRARPGRSNDGAASGGGAWHGDGAAVIYVESDVVGVHGVFRCQFLR